MSSSISDAEWQVRRDLAACYRMFVKFGWTDLIFTHLSARVPGSQDQYLINPYGLLFQEITASNLIKVDFEGNVIAGDHPFNDAGHAIHTAVLSARPDVNVVLHSHTRAGTAVSSMSEGLLPLSQQAMEVMDLVSYHAYYYAPDDSAECDRLAADFADKWLMIMHNHGLISAGRTIAEAFYYLYMLENACKIQVDVMRSGSKPILPDEASIKSFIRHTAISNAGPHAYTGMCWQALLRQLELEDTGWKRQGP